MTETAKSTLTKELMWLIGTLPPLAMAAFVTAAYLRRASVAFMLQVPSFVLGDVVGPTLWTLYAGLDVGVGVLAFLVGTVLRDNELRAVLSVIAAASLMTAGLMMFWGLVTPGAWVLWMSGLAALVALGRCVQDVLKGTLPTRWVPLGGGLVLIVAVVLVLRSSIAAGLGFDYEDLDLSFPAIVRLEFEDAIWELEPISESNAVAVYLLGKDQTHTFLAVVENDNRRTVAVRSQDVKLVTFRSEKGDPSPTPDATRPPWESVAPPPGQSSMPDAPPAG